MFNRKEIRFKMEAKVTPSRIEVGKSISEKLSTGIDTIEIKKISGRFGSNNFDINVFVYETKEDLKKQNCAARIRNGKLGDETQLWMRRLRDEAYVDIRM